MPRIAIFVDDPDWHARQLVAALAAFKAEGAVISLRDCAFAVGEGGGAGIRVPGFEDRLPDAVLARTISAGSFEQITLRLSFLHALGLSGVPVVNDARAIERCVDKSMTSFLLHRAGIRTVPTFASESLEQARSWAKAREGDLVQKPLFGAQGKGLIRYPAAEAPVPEPLYNGAYYLQPFIGRDREWRDYRVLVVGGKPVAAMLRHGTSWITNVHQGARCEAAALTDRLVEPSLAAAAAVGAAYAGIDLIEDESGELVVLEVNSMPAWKGLQSVAPCNVAEAIIAHVLANAA